jgi:hypothetical protein
VTRIYRRLESLEAGLKSNQAVGRVDVYQAHWKSYHRPTEYAWQRSGGIKQTAPANRIKVLGPGWMKRL